MVQKQMSLVTVADVARDEKHEDELCSFSLPLSKWRPDPGRARRVDGGSTVLNSCSTSLESRSPQVESSCHGRTYQSDLMTIEGLSESFKRASEAAWKEIRHEGKPTSETFAHTANAHLDAEKDTRTQYQPLLDRERSFSPDGQADNGQSFVLGSAEMPTIGSASHYRGNCRPCGFVFKKAGCDSGVSCIFCHLCDVKERQRRAKVRRTALRALKRQHEGISITVMQVPTKERR